MELSIIILNYRQKDLVRQCIEKIRSLDLKSEHEIVVVDNASADGCEKMIMDEFAEAKFVQAGTNRGYAAGNNQGIAVAEGKYLLILNPDVEVAEGSVEKMLTFMESHPECGLCGPKLLNPDGSLQLSCRRFPDWKIPVYQRTILGKLPFGKKAVKKYLTEDWDHAESRAVEWMLGACLMARKSAADKVGPMDERFFLYFEDVDWCRRFWEAGYQVCYVADAEMTHRHQRISARKRGLKSLLDPATRAHVASGLKYFLKYKFRTRPKTEKQDKIGINKAA